MIINKYTSQYFRSSESCVERFSYFVRAIRKEGRKEGRKSSRLQFLKHRSQQEKKVEVYRCWRERAINSKEREVVREWERDSGIAGFQLPAMICC